MVGREKEEERKKKKSGVGVGGGGERETDRKKKKKKGNGHFDSNHTSKTMQHLRWGEVNTVTSLYSPFLLSFDQRYHST